MKSNKETEIIVGIVKKTNSRTVGQKQSARYGLLLDNEQWYNGWGEEPAKEGDTVKITYYKSGYGNAVTDIEVNPESIQHTTPKTTTETTTKPEDPKPIQTQQGYWGEREKREIENSNRISRHGAINTALQLLEISVKYGGGMDFEDAAKNAERFKADKIMDVAEVLAERILKFVNQKNV